MSMASSNLIYQKKGLQGVFHVLILLLSLFLILSISFDTFKNIPFVNQRSYLRIQFWICMFFLLDFVLEFFLSKRKWHYLATRWLFLIVSIPYLNIIDYYHLSFSPELSYFIRFIPLIRGGYALAIVVGWLSSNRISGLFTSYITMLMATVYFSSLIFYGLERGVNPMVKDYGSALWWAFMDVTTVGSNIYAMTVTGKVLSVVLAALGMMMFPIFTVYITSLVEKANKRKIDYYKALESNTPSSGTFK